MKIDRAVLADSWHSWVSNDNRPRAGPWWLQWLWTGLFCASLALPFTVLGFLASARHAAAWRDMSGWAYWYGKNLIVCLTIGAIIHVLFDTSRRLFATPERVCAWKPWQRTLFFSGTPLLGVAIGWPLGLTLAGADIVAWFGSPHGANIVVGSVLVSLSITFLFHHFFAAKAHQAQAEKRATEAQLRLLQGQIEPHFLFNTLANVTSLIDHDTVKAKRMLESFTDYLRSSLTSLRRDDATLGSELDLVQAYLGVLKTRMEDRLQFSIDADPALRAAHLPPLLLQPLVENAIHHGIEPKVEGGRVRVSARLDGPTLVLEVADDGLGLDAPPRRAGSGLALVNLRERLRTQYGERATLTLGHARPGTLATLRLPYREETAA
jgi:two-component sensor histidine kinase